MSIAALQALVSTLTEEKSTLELSRTIIDQRRQTLAFHQQDLYSEQTEMYKKYVLNQEKDREDEDPVDDFNWKEFQVQYDAQVAKLDAQDKLLEMERTNIDTKVEAVSTSLESAEKQLSKNVENDMKTQN